MFVEPSNKQGGTGLHKQHKHSKAQREPDQPATHLLLVLQTVQSRSSPPLLLLLLLWWLLLCSSSSLLHRWSLSSNIQPVTTVLPFFLPSFLLSTLPRCPSSPSKNRKSINCAPSRHRHPISARMQPQPRTLSGSSCSSSSSSASYSTFSSSYCFSYCSSPSSFTSPQFYSVPPASVRADMRRRKPTVSPGCSSLHQLRSITVRKVTKVAKVTEMRSSSLT